MVQVVKFAIKPKRAIPLVKYDRKTESKNSGKIENIFFFRFGFHKKI